MAYVCRGSASVDVAPSPNSHRWLTPPEREPVKAMVSGLFCTATEVAAGAGVGAPPV